MQNGKGSGSEPLIGKRVVSMSLLSQQITVLGTIQEVERFDTGIEYWRVLLDNSMMQEAPSTSFEIYDGPEFAAGDRVRYRLDEGGYWEAVVVKPIWAFTHLRYVIRVTDGSKAAVKMNAGGEIAEHPAKLSKMDS